MFFSDTRLKFLVYGREGGKGVPMACCMVYWGKYHYRFKNIFQKYGYVISLNEL